MNYKPSETYKVIVAHGINLMPPQHLPNIHFLKHSLWSLFSSQLINFITDVLLQQVWEIQAFIRLVTQSPTFKVGIYKCPGEEITLPARWSLPGWTTLKQTEDKDHHHYFDGLAQITFRRAPRSQRQLKSEFWEDALSSQTLLITMKLAQRLTKDWRHNTL